METHYREYFPKCASRLEDSVAALDKIVRQHTPGRSPLAAAGGRRRGATGAKPLSSGRPAAEALLLQQVLLPLDEGWPLHGAKQCLFSRNFTC